MTHHPKSHTEPAGEHGHTHAASEHGHTHAANEHGHTHEHNHAGESGARHAAAAGFTPDAKDASLSRREELAEGCGKGGILFFDASSGLAGDMTVAALLHLGVPFSVVQRAIDALGLSGYRLSASVGRIGAIGACQFDVAITGAQEERHYREIVELLRASSLSPSVIETSIEVFRRLGEAEARVHGIALEQVHFHEVGALDSIADIVGAVAAIQYVGAELVATPLPLGHGFVHCRHGVIPLPAPATVECLRGVPTYAANVEAETVTPTGAAIIGTLCHRFMRWPDMSPERIGWGAGSHVLSDRTNALRVVLGRASTRSEADPLGHAGHPGHVVLEANLDDMTGELTGYVLALLMQSGALDAWAVPITMKKGRPAVILSAIVAPEDSIRLSELILRETTTLGVRRTETGRIERPRKVVSVMTRYGSVQVKVSQGPYGPMQIKPEFDDCARVASENQVPVREVIAEALCKARAELLG
jgi:uncharacterized protein (TIGR00299 family) protein